MLWALKTSDAHTLASKETVERMFGPAPYIPFGYDFYVTAFFDLCTERPQAMGGVCSIPISKVAWYAERYGVTNQEKFVNIIDKLDGVYINFLNKKQEQNRKN